MSKKLIAIHSIQTSDKDGKRVDVRPGGEFEAANAKEAADLIAAGAAREKTADDKKAAEAKGADDQPSAPAGYSSGTASAADVNDDPNAAVDTGSATTDTAKGEAAKGESSTKSGSGVTRR